MPMTAFIGVRISWLIVARNELLASFAASAAARASCVSWNRRAFWMRDHRLVGERSCSIASSLSVKGSLAVRRTCRSAPDGSRSRATSGSISDD